MKSAAPAGGAYASNRVAAVAPLASGVSVDVEEGPTVDDGLTVAPCECVAVRLAVAKLVGDDEAAAPGDNVAVVAAVTELLVDGAAVSVQLGVVLALAPRDSVAVAVAVPDNDDDSVAVAETDDGAPTVSDGDDDGETDGDAEGEEAVLEVLGETLGDGLGVPLHTHTLSEGAPHETKQHSAGHCDRVGDGDSEALGDGAVGDADADWQVHTTSGNVPVQTQAPRQGVCESDGVTLASTELDGLTLAASEGDGLTLGDDEDVADTELEPPQMQVY